MRYINHHQVIWWRDEKASAKNFNAVSHNRARPEVLLSNLKHGGPWRSKESVYLYVSCCCKTCGSFQTDNAGVLELTERRRHFPSLGETLQCRKSSKRLTEKTPSKKENNKLRKFKVLRHGNTGHKLASQSPPKLWHPRFHSTVLSVGKCGHQTWFIYELLK